MLHSRLTLEEWLFGDILSFPMLDDGGHTQILGWCRCAGRKTKQRTQAALEQVNMLGFKPRPIGQLSGGQPQRVFLACALAQQDSMRLVN